MIDIPVIGPGSNLLIFSFLPEAFDNITPLVIFFKRMHSSDGLPGKPCTYNRGCVYKNRCRICSVFAGRPCLCCGLPHSSQCSGKQTDLFDRCMTLNPIYRAERLKVQFFPDGSAGVRCIIVRIIVIYRYTLIPMHWAFSWIKCLQQDQGTGSKI